VPILLLVGFTTSYRFLSLFVSPSPYPTTKRVASLGGVATHPSWKGIVTGGYGVRILLWR
jgi:hypothetical protein